MKINKELKKISGGLTIEGNVSADNFEFNNNRVDKQTLNHRLNFYEDRRYITRDYTFL